MVPNLMVVSQSTLKACLRAILSTFVLATLPAISATISGFTPAQGAAGTVVTISGTALQTVSAVFFGSMEASGEILSRNASSIQARVPPNALTGQISVFSPQGSASSFQIFVAAPRIEEVDPPSGSIGTLVTISGVNFGTGTARGNITSVTFNETPAAFQITGLGQLVAQVPPDATSGPITVANEAGSFTTLTPFHIAALVTGFNPPRGMPGDAVEIRGLNLGNAVAINFGQAAASFSIQSPSNVVANVPTNAINGVLQITTPAGVAVTSSNFVVLPRIIQFSPAFGAVGTNVVLLGGGFHGLTEVRFNDVKATTVKTNSSTRVEAVVPAGAATGPIKIVTTNGTFTTEADFVFPARVTSFTPGSGRRGDVITIDGQNLTSTTRVLFNGVEAEFTIVSPSRITATIPASATSGKIAVETPAGKVESSASLTILPVLDGFTPTSGARGTPVHLLGAGFTNIAWVRLGDADATFTFINSTNIRAIVPLGAYSGPFRLLSAGNEVASSANFFVEGATPEISSFTPASGSAGTMVTVTGKGLLTAAKVEFNGAEATFSVVSSTEVKATVPAGANSGPIAVTTLDGIAISASAFQVPGGEEVRLSAERTAQEIILRWPASAEGYVLEEASSVGPSATWSDVNQTPVLEGTTLRVTLTISSEGARFFRLAK